MFNPCQNRGFFQHSAVTRPPCLVSLLHYSTSFFHQSFWPSLYRLILFNQLETTLITRALLSTDYLGFQVPSPEPNPGFWERFFFSFQTLKVMTSSPSPPGLWFIHSLRKSNSTAHQLRPVLCVLWLLPKQNTSINPTPLSGLNMDQSTQPL